MTVEPILRLMTAPDGDWPQRVALGNREVDISYRDFQGKLRDWRCILIEARQSDTTILIEVFRQGEHQPITLRLNRMISMNVCGMTGQPAAFLIQVCGMPIQQTAGPRSSIPWARAPLVQETKSGPLAGMRVAFAGQFDSFSIAQIGAIVTRCGGTAIGTVSTDLAFLVVGEGAGRKKSAAERLGIRCITEATFIELIGGICPDEAIT